jgi:hypothetical protein
VTFRLVAQCFSQEKQPNKIPKLAFFKLELYFSFKITAIKVTQFLINRSFEARVTLEVSEDGRLRPRHVDP